MSSTPTDGLIDRLAALLKLSKVPRHELEWLVAHGHLESGRAGSVIGHKGVPMTYLWVLLSGHVTVHVDRGAGLRQVIEWGSGDISGMLPYSRMKAPPGDTTVEADCEYLAVHVDQFPEMVCECPMFTALTVQTMVDRARTFNTSGLQDEKMISLGKLAAGLAHELNNPASATVRGAKQLPAALVDSDTASRGLGAAGLPDEALAAIEALRVVCMNEVADKVRSPVEQADREDEVADWLARHGADPVHATPLAETAVTLEALDGLARVVPGAALDPALRWIAAGCRTRSLARDIEQAAGRIHDLVAAIKRFTYMDTAAGREAVDLSIGLRDTVQVLAAKARAAGAGVTLDLPPDLPRAEAIGSELNQIWLNLLDNALDAVGPSGQVTVSARQEGQRVVVRVVDNGPGIPPEVLPRIFDPFFTTKPPGQGVGLGLDITQQLVRQSHGEISVESLPGHTEFRVSLAAVQPWSP